MKLKGRSFLEQSNLAALGRVGFIEICLLFPLADLGSLDSWGSLSRVGVEVDVLSALKDLRCEWRLLLPCLKMLKGKKENTLF